MTQLIGLGFLANPLATFVLPETLAATNLAGDVAALQSQGVAVFTYPRTVRLIRLRQPIGAFQFAVTGPPGAYAILGSTDLAGWSVVGTVDNPLGAIVFTDVTAHLSPQKFYRVLLQSTPANMVLAAAGDFTEGALRAWADELFGGDWGRSSSPLPTRANEPPARGVRVLLKTEEVKEAWVNLAFELPGVDHPDTPALDVLAMLAGQGDGSRLFWALIETGLADEAQAQFDGRDDHGEFLVFCSCSPENAAQVQRITELGGSATPKIKRGLQVQRIEKQQSVAGLQRSQLE